MKKKTALREFAVKGRRTSMGVAQCQGVGDAGSAYW